MKRVEIVKVVACVRPENRAIRNDISKPSSAQVARPVISALVSPESAKCSSNPNSVKKSNSWQSRREIFIGMPDVRVMHTIEENNIENPNSTEKSLHHSLSLKWRLVNVLEML